MSIASPPSMTAAIKSLSSTFFLAAFSADSDIARMTVSMVPSLGLVTALYAISVPLANAFANVFAVISVLFERTEVMPLRI